MSEITINAWVNQEKSGFDNFTAYVATSLQNAVMAAIPKTLADKIDKGDDAVVEVPWGTYSATVKKVGEATNVTPSFVPARAFVKALNDDESHHNYKVGDMDPDLVKNISDYLAWGRFGTPTEKEMLDLNKGMRLDIPEELEYVLASYEQLLVTLARDHQRSGKEYELEVETSDVNHGKFIFKYDDDEIVVRFEPSTAFKQQLKRDDIGVSTDVKKAAFSKVIRLAKRNNRRSEKDRDGFTRLIHRN